jgi:tripartite-type tricarboxylate transporter receptor subunit TctC
VIHRDIAIVGWFGLFAPAGTSPEIVKKLNAEINRITALPEMRPHYLGLALRPVTASTEQLTGLIEANHEYDSKLVKALNLKLE